MKFDNKLTDGKILKRYKRFLADIELDSGEMITAHVPNTGSMTTCWAPGQKVLLSESDNQKRKYKYTLEMTYSGKSWVGVNTMRTNKLASEAILNGTIVELQEYKELITEVKVGDSRIDLLLKNSNDDQAFVEVKNVTLLSEDGELVLFPDAVTKRGQKHLKELISIKESGHRAVMLFIIQREEARKFSPALNIDPAYATLLKEASESGVELLVYGCYLSKDEVVVTRSMPIIWGEGQ